MRNDHDHDAHARATLFETERGRVTRCGGCGALELRFGNALLAVRPEELATVLLAALAEAEADARAAAVHGVPAAGVTLYLGDSACGWVFDRAESAELHRLVAGARLLLDLADAA